MVLTTLSKELFAPFSCVKRARARFALRPRSSTVKVSMARETGRMWSASDRKISIARQRSTVGWAWSMYKEDAEF